MLTIRLRRAGAKRDPHYRVVVTESSTRRDGPFIEILGHYHPRRQPAEIVLDMDRVESYVGQGAQMSDTVRSLCRRVRAGGGEVEAPAETAATANASDDAELEAAAELEADSGTQSEQESEGDSEGESESDSEEDPPAEDEPVVTEEADKQD